jgi:hypothetical protein
LPATGDVFLTATNAKKDSRQYGNFVRIIAELKRDVAFSKGTHSPPHALSLNAASSSFMSLSIFWEFLWAQEQIILAGCSVIDGPTFHVII